MFRSTARAVVPRGSRSGAIRSHRAPVGRSSTDDVRPAARLRAQLPVVVAPFPPRGGVDDRERCWCP